MVMRVGGPETAYDDELSALAAARELFPHASPCMMRDSYHTVNETR